MASSSDPQRLVDWRRQALHIATLSGISPVEVDRLIEQVTGWNSLHRLLSHPPDPQVDWDRLDHLWQQRVKSRIPLQYLLGQTTWRQLQLTVTPAVLIPRPETEMMVEIAQEWMGSQADPAGIWVDLGTGSGAIAISLAMEMPQISVYAVDISPEALAIASENVDRQGFSERIQLLSGDWFEPLDSWRGRIRGMVSNPPYIPSALIDQLDPEVKDHEPKLALDGGETGLEAIQILIEQAPFYLQPGGFWLVEVMQGQAESVAEQLRQNGGYDRIRLHWDLSGIARMVSGQTIG